MTAKAFGFLATKMMPDNCEATLLLSPPPYSSPLMIYPPQVTTVPSDLIAMNASMLYPIVAELLSEV